ncbi:hypothetical protein [Dyella sp. 2YAF14]|uniref:hypothetical protein n=1 Tax=Dyella sp. 2YAF14 TaxID=3233025 RepID=UPI003F9185E5
MNAVNAVNAVNAKNARPDYLFLDCEWADVMAQDLVSIGIASIDGKRIFYAELDPLPPDPTPWVRAVVYPLLDGGETAMAASMMSYRLRAFLATFDRPLICYDYVADRVLCERVLEQHLDQEDLAGSEGIQWLLLTDVAAALKRWWEEHSDLKPKRHHALADALALRAAYLSLWGL